MTYLQVLVIEIVIIFRLSIAKYVIYYFVLAAADAVPRMATEKSFFHDATNRKQNYIS